jgi:hypothetical protein
MFLRASSFFMALCAPAILLAQQTPGNVQSVQNASATPAPHPALPSATVQPSLDVLKQALATMNIEKWKASPAIRTEADGNLRSIQRDVEATLPPLLATADTAPNSVSKTLPVFRNVDALYDVMLRLDAAGRLAAPKDQISALDQALASLSDVRHTLGDQVQANAEAQDTNVTRLQAALKAVPPPAPPPAPVACTPPPVTRKKRVTKPAAKPAPSTSTTTPTPTH